MSASKPPIRHANFRRFFVRGLSILLPTVLTIWILIAAYNFVQVRIAEPINAAVRTGLVLWSPWPVVVEAERLQARQDLAGDDRAAWMAAGSSEQWLERHIKRQKVRQWWERYQYGADLIGLAIAVVLIYTVGLLLGSFIGHRLYARGEELLKRLPLVKQVYPALKQITEFLFGSEEQLRFSRVVAVQYPRPGIWSVGLVTGDTMQTIQKAAGVPCMTVFIPSSPTPFTGYTITVPVKETVDLPITIEDALRFVVSGGVVLPPNEAPARGNGEPPAPLRSPSGDPLAP